MDNTLVNKKKIAFFVRPGLDSFLDEIVNGLTYEYETRKIIVYEYSQIDEGMEWADICWFEWCDDLICYGSRKETGLRKKIICRLHSYEAFTDYPSMVKWDAVDKIIFVGKHIRDFFVDASKIDKEKTVVIPNGVDMEKYTFKDRGPGFNIAYVGYINYKKGPMLLLHTFKEIYGKDNRYKLYIAGEFQDTRDILYFSQMIRELKLESNIFFEGWQNNLNEWLEDKNYILCTSILESQNMSVMQAMAKGIKPLIHNFVGARTIYQDSLIFNTIQEAVILLDGKYDSQEYRRYIEKSYSTANTQKLIKKEIFSLLD